MSRTPYLSRSGQARHNGRRHCRRLALVGSTYAGVPSDHLGTGEDLLDCLGIAEGDLVDAFQGSSGWRYTALPIRRGSRSSETVEVE
jgi:hypothetical protein